MGRRAAWLWTISISHPRWSADGRFVAYRRADNDGKGSAIVLVSADSGAKQPLTTSGMTYRAPYDWSGDGRWILGACEHGPLGLRSVCLLPVSGAPRAEAQMRVIASDPERNLFQGTFSPDEDWIAFEAADRSTASTIYVVDADGRRWIPITEGAFWDDKPRCTGWTNHLLHVQWARLLRRVGPTVRPAEWQGRRRGVSAYRFRKSATASFHANADNGPVDQRRSHDFADCGIVWRDLDSESADR